MVRPLLWALWAVRGRHCEGRLHKGGLSDMEGTALGDLPTATKKSWAGWGTNGTEPASVCTHQAKFEEIAAVETPDG